MNKHTATTTRRLMALILAAALLFSAAGCKKNTPTVPESTQAASLSETQTHEETLSGIPETSAPASADDSQETGSGSAGSILITDEVIPVHSDLMFEDMVYARPDLDALSADFERIPDLAAGENAEELFALYDSLLMQIQEISKMDTLATLQNEIDLSNTYYEEEMNLLDNELTRIDNRMNDATQTILDSSHKDAFIHRMGEDFIARYEFNSKLNSPEIEELSDQENALITEYKKLLSKEYTTTYKGVEVTIDDLDFSDPNIATPYYDIVQQKNQECAAVYKELLTVRTKIAKTLGYDSYANYAYDCLGRDFTKEDAAAFSAMVKEYLVPLYQDLDAAYYYEIQNASADSTLTIEDGFPILRAALSEEFPAAMTEALDYMLDHDLYIMDDDPNMMPAGFTTLIDGFAAPYLFINTSVYTDPSTLFHEFGHYYNFYLMGSTLWNDSNNLDLAEIHSQGLELLMFAYYNSVYGENADLMEVSVILDLLYSILAGCCEDEFQQAVYKNPYMSIDDMNALHGRLYSEYFGYPLYYEWVDIHHHFETPFYYISYATSAISAFEIWDISQSDRDLALDCYRSISQNTLNCGYLAPLERAGLSNPFTSDMVIDLADTLYEEYLIEEGDQAA